MKLDRLWNFIVTEKDVILYLEYKNDFEKEIDMTGIISMGSPLLVNLIRPRQDENLSVLGKSLDINDGVTLSAGRTQESNYTAGKVIARAAIGAIVGAAAITLSGGGVLATAALGAAVWGVTGAVMGGIVGAIAGAGVNHPVAGAAVGAAGAGGIGAVGGAIKGALIGGVAGLFGGGPVAGAVAGGLLSAAGL